MMDTLEIEYKKERRKEYCRKWLEKNREKHDEYIAYWYFQKRHPAANMSREEYSQKIYRPHFKD